MERGGPIVATQEKRRGRYHTRGGSPTKGEATSGSSYGCSPCGGAPSQDAKIYLSLLFVLTTIVFAGGSVAIFVYRERKKWKRGRRKMERRFF